MEEKNTESGISLSDILRVIWKNIILVLIVTAFVTACGAVYTLAIAKPTYKASSQVIVAVEQKSSGDSTYVDTTNTLRITETIADLCETRAVLVPVAKKLGATTDEEVNSYVAALQSALSESYSTTNYIVGLTVVARKAENAVEYVNLIAESLVDYVSTDSSLGVFGAKLSVVDEAVAGTYNSPNKTLYLLVSFVIGLVVSLVIVFFKEFMSTKFKTKDEIVAATKNRVIGVFTDHKSRETKDGKAKLVEPNIQNFEPYNNLYTNIRYAGVDNPYKVIMITSTIEDELKTTVISNLAYAIKNNEKSVIVIDLDLRKPSIHNAFNVERANGIVEYITGEATADTVIKKTSYGIDVITAGAPVVNPYVILDSIKMKQFIDELREKYDYVFIDTPPLAVCADAFNVTKNADGVIYNVTVDQVKKKMFAEKASAMDELDNKVIGFNITKLKVGRGNRDNYYYSYKYYGEHAKTENTEK